MVLDWVKVRLEHKRQKRLQEYARKGGGQFINYVDGGGGAPSETSEKPRTPAAVQQSSSVAPEVLEQINTMIVAALKGKPAKAAANAKAKTKAGPRSSAAGPKFKWDPEDCWHCKEKHRREDGSA